MMNLLRNNWVRPSNLSVFQSQRYALLYFTYTQPLKDLITFFLSNILSAYLVVPNFCNKNLLFDSVQVRVIFMLKPLHLIMDFCNY